jgi:hypothetical protein
LMLGATSRGADSPAVARRRSEGRRCSLAWRVSWRTKAVAAAAAGAVSAIVHRPSGARATSYSVGLRRPNFVHHCSRHPATPARSLPISTPTHRQQSFQGGARVRAASTAGIGRIRAFCWISCPNSG